MTLIEILIVMTILIILAALAAAGARVALNITRNNATKVLLAQIQTALDEKMQKFIMDTQANQPIDYYAYFAGGNPGLSPSSTEGQRAAIIARMDAMRSAFPQSFAEMVPPQNLTLIRGATSASDFYSQLGTALSNSNTDTGGTALAPALNPYPSHQSIFVAYLLATGQLFDESNPNNQQNASRFSAATGYGNQWFKNPQTNYYDPITRNFSSTPVRTIANGNPASAHDPQTESAECLYLILADKTGSTSSFIDELPSQFIRDTDNDGLLEIVDSWGKPIKFYRWAPDTFAYFIEVTQQYKGVGKPGDVNGDGVADTIVGSNSLDPNNLLYDLSVPTSFFRAASAVTVSGFSANIKDLFESLFGRLHGAYSYDHSNPNLTSLTPTLDNDADAIDYNAINNRNEHSTTYLGATTGAEVPRSYPFRSLVVSAGADGKFGMYDLESQTPNTGGTVGVTYPQIHIGYKCGRVEDDLTKRPDFNDNVFSVELQEGIKQ